MEFRVALLQLQASLPAERRLENEAERLRLVQQLLNLSTSSSTTLSKSNTRRSNSAKALKGLTSTAEPAPIAGLGATAERSVGDASSTVEVGSRRPLAAPELPELVSGHYLLDFGSVTKGINKSKKVKMINLSSQMVSAVLVLQP